MIRGLVVLFCSLLVLAGNEDPEWDQYSARRGDYAASHILVAYQTALRADASITRNKPEALARASELLAKVIADPSSFERIAREASDGPTAVLAGYLGVVSWGRFDAKFEKAVKKLEPGEIVSKPVLTDFGYHIIRRESLYVKNYAANLLVITYRGADNVDGIPYRIENRKQSKEDAKLKIDQLAAEVTPGTFAALCEEKSDFRKPGGFYGNFKISDSVTSALLINGLKDIGYGQLTGVIELPFGYAIAQRMKVVKLAGARIIILHKDAKNAPRYMTRSREEAKEMASELLREVLADPSQFEKVSKKDSEGHYTGHSGLMPVWLAGDKEASLDQALQKVAFGEIVPEVLDLEDGYSIVRRIDPMTMDSQER